MGQPWETPINGASNAKKYTATIFVQEQSPTTLSGGTLRVPNGKLSTMFWFISWVEISDLTRISPVLRSNILFQTSCWGVHVSFQGCYTYQKMIRFSELRHYIPGFNINNQLIVSMIFIPWDRSFWVLTQKPTCLMVVSLCFMVATCCNLIFDGCNMLQSYNLNITHSREGTNVLFHSCVSFPRNFNDPFVWWLQPQSCCRVFSSTPPENPRYQGRWGAETAPLEEPVCFLLGRKINPSGKHDFGKSPFLNVEINYTWLVVWLPSILFSH